MALPTSGTITLAQIANEFGAPYTMSSLYRGGAYVGNFSANANVPTSGAIAFSNFYGAQKAFAGGNVSYGSLAELGAVMVGPTNSPTAGGSLTINGQVIGSGYDYKIIDGSTTVSSFADGTYFTGTQDTRPALIAVNGNLTINSGITFTPSVRKPFIFIYVKGNLVLNGVISMSQRGCNHYGGITARDIRIATGTFGGVSNPQVPTAAGTSGGTGNGGAGKGGDGGCGSAGMPGTSYTGGTGGGAQGNGYCAIPAQVNGGRGGDARSSSDGNGGGAGNPGGSGSGGGGSGGTGTGGVVIIYCTGAASGAGSITAAGATGGAGGTFGGGGSGGGSVTLICAGSSGSIAVSADGGAGGYGGWRFGGYGSPGSAGTARKLVY